ncbi:hypothetical protein BDV06DRAFT_216292 [Aspergillus oleicola]
MDVLTMKQRATQIADIATSLADELNCTGYPEPSFQHGLPIPLQGDAPVSRASQLHRKLAQLVDELNALLTDPTLLLTPELVLVHPLIRLRIPANFPENGTFVSELAAALQLDEGLVRRLLAHSATYHVFYEAEPDFFVHTAASRLLATDEGLCDWILIGMEEMLPGTFKTADALLRYPGSEEPADCGWGVANNIKKPMFQALGKMPLRGERFARAMKWRVQAPGFAIRYLVDAFPWPNGDAQGQFTVVDVGGGLGHVSRALSKHAPNAQFIVQDTTPVAAQGKAALSVIDGRIRFEGHDFFEQQPAHGADVYLLRLILHDWSDKYATMILKALVPALRPGAKVVINDRVVPGRGEAHYLNEREARDYDLYMMSLQNGRERTAEDVRALLNKVDKRFELTKVHQLVGSVLAVVEVTWIG